jgi:hypothetical protein
MFSCHLCAVTDGITEFGELFLKKKKGKDKRKNSGHRVMNVKDKRPPKRFSFQIGRENGRHYLFTSFFTRNRYPGQHGNILHGHNSYFLF